MADDDDWLAWKRFASGQATVEAEEDTEEACGRFDGDAGPLSRSLGGEQWDIRREELRFKAEPRHPNDVMAVTRGELSLAQYRAADDLQSHRDDEWATIMRMSQDDDGRRWDVAEHRRRRDPLLAQIQAVTRQRDWERQRVAEKDEALRQTQGNVAELVRANTALRREMEAIRTHAEDREHEVQRVSAELLAARYRASQVTTENTELIDKVQSLLEEKSGLERRMADVEERREIELHQREQLVREASARTNELHFSRMEKRKDHSALLDLRDERVMEQRSVRELRSELDRQVKLVTELSNERLFLVQKVMELLGEDNAREILANRPAAAAHRASSFELDGSMRSSAVDSPIARVIELASTPGPRSVDSPADRVRRLASANDSTAGSPRVGGDATPPKDFSTPTQS